METSTCPGAPKLDPRVRRTKKLLEDAFRSLLNERPYSEISVGDVTERATVNRATFYAHYEDKRHLASAMLKGDLESTLCSRLTHGIPAGADSLGVIAEAIFEFMGRVPGECPKHADQLAPTFMTTLQETIQAFLTRWLENDREALTVFPAAGRGPNARETVATVLAWSLFGAALRWSHQPRRPPAAQASREVVALLICRPTK